MFAFLATTATVEFTQQFLLAIGQVDRGFHHDVRHQIAWTLATHTLDALAAQAEHLAALGLAGDLDTGMTFECGNLDFTAQRRRGEGNRQFAMEVVMFALEYLMCLDVNLHIEIPWRPTIDAGLPFPG